MNWSIYTADRATHLKVVVVGLAAALLIAVIGISATQLNLGTDILTAQGPTVIIVDDDDDMRGALANLFNSVGLEAVVFGSAQELLAAKFPETPSCLVLDIRLPGISGLEF